MKFISTNISGLLIIEPKIYEDSRGYFFESFQKDIFKNQGIDVDFIQDNQSLSHKGALRGLHFQNPPYAQGKLVRVIKGAVLDVVLDIRKDSATYGQHFSIELTEQNNLMLWIPEGFAHGFQTLKNDTVFFYKCSNKYNKESEGCILWNDETLAIPWVNIPAIISEKDQQGASFKEFKSHF